MKKHPFLPVSIFLFFLLIVNVSVGQNLVPNPSFEVQDTCPKVSQILLASPWNSPSLGTPDLFNSSCSSQSLSARTGVGSSGFFCLFHSPSWPPTPNSREYVQVPLDVPLIEGQTYCVSFYTRRHSFRYAINSIGAYFSVGALNQNNDTLLNFTAQIQNDSSNIIQSSSTWVEIAGSFVASGGESHLIIGNFYDDANTDTLVVSNSSIKAAYYLIDDVSVTPCLISSTSSSDAIGQAISVYPVPASQLVHLKLESDIDISSSTIIDLQGRKIMDIPFDLSNAGTYKLDISILPVGIYFISIQTAFGIINKKIIVFR